MMAPIKELHRKEPDRVSVLGEVEATYHIFEKDGETYLQIDTYRSPYGTIPGKITQTLQLGPEGIAKLRDILGQVLDRRPIYPPAFVPTFPAAAAGTCRWHV